MKIFQDAFSRGSGLPDVPSANRICGRGLMITGTDTGVGKTQVTCLIARQMVAAGLRVGPYKPVCSGALLSSRSEYSPDASVLAQDNDGTSARLYWEDIQRLSEATGQVWPDELICPQRFVAPVAPPVAAAMEGREVDFARAVKGAYQFADADVILIEGAGGWLSPVARTATVADLAQQWNLPVLVVARTGLGTINHTLLTLESIRARRLRVAGVVLNEAVPVTDDQSRYTNAEEIAIRGEVRVLGTIPFGMQNELQHDGESVTIPWLEFTGDFAASHEMTSGSIE